MKRSVLLLCFFVSLFKIIESRLSIKHQNNAIVVAMVPSAPQGGHCSKQVVTNKLKPPPGCSVNRSETNKRDGSIEIIETLSGTIVINISPSNRVTIDPKFYPEENDKVEQIINWFQNFLKQRR